MTDLEKENHTQPIEKNRSWFSKNKKRILIGGTIALILAGSGIGYILCGEKEVSFPNWLKNATTEELNEAYEKQRLNFCKTGVRGYVMMKIDKELNRRSAPSHILNPNFRWTDKHRWEK